MILGIVQSKGGVGRSTVATNLAAGLAATAPTLLIDADMPQGTSASWAAVRSGTPGLGNLSVASAGNRAELDEATRHASGRFRHIVVDGPPRITDTTLAILEISDLALLPLGSSASEIWACADLVDLICRLRERGTGIDARILWTRYRWYTRAARELSGRAEAQLGLPAFDVRLSHRVAYADAFARGLSVLEWSDKAAGAEVSTLLGEVRAILQGRRPRRRTDRTRETSTIIAFPPPRAPAREGA